MNAMALCAFPYLDNEAMSYFKAKWEGCGGQSEEGEKRVKLAERERERKRDKKNCLPLARGPLSSRTDSCNINMSEQRSRAYHAC